MTMIRPKRNALRSQKRNAFAWLVTGSSNWFRANARKVVPSQKDASACRAFLNKFKTGIATLGETSFEAHIGMFALLGGVSIGQIKLNFEVEKGRRVLLVDAIQGARGTKNLRWTFRRFHGSFWPNFLIRKAVETAREAGFSEIRIAKPELSPYYRKLPKEKPSEAEERQKRMRRLYYEVAKAEGFEEKEGYFFLKL